MKIFTPLFFSTKNKLVNALSIFAFAFCLLLSSIDTLAQTQATMAVRGDINTFGNSAMTYRSSLAQTWMATVQASATNGASNFLFANNGSFSPKWARGAAVAANAKTTWFASGSDGNYNQTNGRFYTFIFQDVAGGTNSQGYVFETTAAPVSVSAVAQSVLSTSVIPAQAVTVTATTSATLPTGQGVFLRYSTNAFSTSTIVNMTGSGTSYTANIPGATNTAGANVVYYVFTSGGTTPPASADADLATINLNNNSGSNYSYTVNTPAAIYAHDFGSTTITTHPYTVSPPTFNANLSNSSWVNNNATTWTSFAGSAGQAIALSSIATPNVWTLTFNVASGFAASVNSFSFWRQSSQSTNTWSMTINGTAVGSGTIPTTGAVNTVNPVTNAVSGLTGTVTVVITFGGALTGSMRIDDFTLNGNVVAQPGPPTLTTPTATVTSPTAATLGATVATNGGAALSARGTSYKTTAGVAATDNQLAEGGTTVSSYTHSRTGLSPQTQYFYVGYATNANGTAISSESNFRTFSNPATVQPATFTTTPGSTSLVANWGTATFPGSGATQAGYAVIYSTSTPTLSSANGAAPAAGVGTLINITPTVLPTTPALTTTISGLVNGTLYNLLIVPYTWDGTNASTYNYFTAGARTTTGTPAAANYVWSGGGAGAWATTTNWTPNSQIGGPASGDTITFNTNVSVSVSSVPTTSLGSITVSGTTAVTLAVAVATSSTITLSNAGTALSIASGASLSLNGNTTGSLTLAYSGAGNTATITGTLNLQLGSGSTGAGRYIATNSTTTVSGALTSNTSVATITSTTANLIFSGTGKFQLTGTSASVVPTATWQTGSLLQMSQSGSTQINVTGLNGQTFSNLTVDATHTGTISFNNTGTLVSFTVSGAYTQSGTPLIELGGSTQTTNISVGGDFQKTAGTISTTISTTNATITLTNTTGANFQCNSSGWVNFTISGTATYTMNGTVAIANNPSIMTVTGILDCAANTVTGTASSTFVLGSAGTLRMGSANGITPTGATGNIQVGGLRTFPTTANYVYNGIVSQVTGIGLPSTVNNLTIANVTNPVTLSAATTVNGTLNLTSGSLNLNALTLTMSATAGQSISGSAGNTFNITGAAGSTLALSGGTSHVVTLSNFGTATSANLITGANVNVQLNSNTQLDCAGNGTSTSMMTILGTLTMNSATASNIANVHPPFYGTGSTLVYNANYGRFSEWINTSGPGYPNNVTVTGSTTLNVINGGTAYLRAAGVLTVNTGSTFSMVNSTVGSGGVGIEFLGNIVNDGTVTLSGTTNQRLKGANFTNGNSNATATTTLASNIGGDLEITGNLTDNANFTSNNRAVFFTGTGVQTIGGTAPGTFNVDYIVSAKASGSIQLLKDLLTGAPNGGNAITLSASTDIFDLNGFTYTLGTGGLASTITGTGVFRGSSASKIIVNGTGAFGTVRFDQTTPGTTNLLSNLTVNRTTGGFTLGNDLIVSTDVALTDGTITLGANNLTIGASGTITVTPSATKMIIASGAGQLRKTFSSNGSFLFPIGDTTANYSPATLNFTAGSYSSAYAGINITKLKHPNNTSATDFINRYWTVTTTGITSPTCTASFTYVTGDVAGTEANLYGGRYLSSTWNCLGVVNTGTHTISSSVTAFGDFTAGEPTLIGCCANPTSGGTIAGTQTICYNGDPTAFTSSALPSGQTGTLEYKWQSSTTSPGTSGFSDISGATATTYDAPSGLTQTTWYKRLSKVTCSGTWGSPGDSNTLQVTISTNTWTGGASTTAWGTSGNWSCGVPLSGSDVVISTASFYPEITSSPTINTLTLDSGTTLIVKSGNNLTVTGAIASAGTLTVENNANVKQTNNVSNTGAGSTIVNRDTATLMRQDYVLWSSPVSGQQLQAFSPQTLSTRFYTFDGSLGSAGQYVATSATGNFSSGVGYLIRLPNNHPATPAIWNGTFTGGNANNGTLTQSGLASGQYYAIGNPYPSTIDADLFIAGNSLTDAMYFWRKTNNTANPSYATYTLAGGVGTANSADPLGLVPNGSIAVGQGFIVKTGGTSLTFTNGMRTTNNSSIFFRTSDIERNRIWLNMTNTSGVFCQTLISYMENATSGIDNLIDGHFLNDSQNALTSIINNEEFAIQGRALPFDVTDTVKLGFKCELAGDYSVSIDHVDGFFTNNEDILLKDNLTNTVHDLRTTPYTFSTVAGVFNSRFEIIYENLLATNQANFNSDKVVVYKQNNAFVINTGKTIMASVKVFDIRGRLLFTQNNINAAQAIINVGDTNEVLLFHITSADGETVIKKAIN